MLGKQNELHLSTLPTSDLGCHEGGPDRRRKRYAEDARVFGRRGHLNSKKYRPPPSTRITGTPMNRIAGI